MAIAARWCLDARTPSRHTACKRQSLNRPTHFNDDVSNAVKWPNANNGIGALIAHATAFDLAWIYGAPINTIHPR
jgi:hypothetical protein